MGPEKLQPLKLYCTPSAQSKKQTCDLACKHNRTFSSKRDKFLLLRNWRFIFVIFTLTKECSTMPIFDFWPRDACMFKKQQMHLMLRKYSVQYNSRHPSQCPKTIHVSVLRINGYLNCIFFFCSFVFPLFLKPNKTWIQNKWIGYFDVGGSWKRFLQREHFGGYLNAPWKK